jgi:hypothetical protein
MEIRVSPRAYGDLGALGPEEYVNVRIAIDAIRSIGQRGGRRIAVVDDRIDFHVFEPPRGRKVIVMVFDPASPEVGDFAGLWPDPGADKRLIQRIASEAASAVGLNNARVYVL